MRIAISGADRWAAIELIHNARAVPADLIPHLRDRAAGKPPTNPIAASLSPEQAQAILNRSPQ